MTVAPPPPPTPPVPPAPPVKKGLSIWAWLAIGCVVLILIGLGSCVVGGYFLKQKIGAMGADFEKNPTKAAAELAVKMNPELEMVRSDDETMTIRNKKTGEEVTVNFEDAKNGKFSFETKDGKATLDASGGEDGKPAGLTVTGPNGEKSTIMAGGAVAAPSWVPQYPGGTASSNYDADNAESHSGVFTVETTDSPDQVATYYKTQLESAGFDVQRSDVSGSDGERSTTLSANSKDQKRQVGVMVSTSEGKTQAVLTFTENKK